MFAKQINKSTIIALSILVAFICGGVGHLCAADYQHASFPIATTTGPEFAVSAAFDGTNYLVEWNRAQVFMTHKSFSSFPSRGTLVGYPTSTGRYDGTPRVGFK